MQIVFDRFHVFSADILHHTGKSCWKCRKKQISCEKKEGVLQQKTSFFRGKETPSLDIFIK